MNAGLTLDAGALVALERGDARVRSLLREALAARLAVHVVPEVVAQCWRGGGRQARLARFLRASDVVLPTYDAETAFAVGRLCARSGHSDVVDVHVALHAGLQGHAVVTSDAHDLRRVDPTLALIEV